MTPLLSIVLTGRNDDHGRDFRTRFFRTLRFNVGELTARRVPYEIVFVEWAPQADRPLLVDMARREVHELDAASFRSYVVDSRYQEALSLNPRLRYLEFSAKNVGIRRAQGQFVLATNCDVFLSRPVLDVFAGGALEPRTLYRAPRHDLRADAVGDVASWEVLEDPGNLENTPPVLKPPLFAGGTGDFVLLDRATFHDLRGFNEIYRVARAGVDANLLVKALSAGITIRPIGGPVYHINHADSYRISRTLYTGRDAEAPWGNIRWHSRGVVYVNGDDWGLARAPETSMSGDVRRLEFTWDAVVPLVDLRRIVLPAGGPGSPAPGRDVPQSTES